jgi:hypothetical protein
MPLEQFAENVPSFSLLSLNIGAVIDGRLFFRVTELEWPVYRGALVLINLF